MDQLTKKQHYVPRFYLQSWSEDGEGHVYLYDLQDATVHPVKPHNIFKQKWFCERDRRFPDNLVENSLANTEYRTSLVMKSIGEILKTNQVYSQESQLKMKLSDILSEETCATIKEFAAYQYLRIPGAIERKAFELKPADIPESYLEEQLKPGNFVVSGYNYVKDRIFQRMGLVLWYSFDEDFLTSDWPCFDLQDSDWAPRLGEEIGREANVFLIFPLAPKLLLTLYPQGAWGYPTILTRPVIHEMTGANVRNVNSLIIQQANRWVVHNGSKDFVFKIAKTRKK